MNTPSMNPLAKHFRQPKLWIKLPSNGNYYPRGSIEISETGEYPVLAMTAKDELMFKTPDALLNGQSTTSVIQSCFPNIKNAWNVPSIDVDAILVAIRIATYGEKMDINVKVPFKKEDGKTVYEERTYEVDLRTVLDYLTANTYENIFDTGDFKFELAPMNYKQFTEVAMKTFEEQRLFKVINDDQLSEEQKLQKFNESFNRITDMNISTIVNSVVAVQFNNDDPVTNKNYIVEFFSNADKTVYKSVVNHIDSQRKKFAIKPLKVRFSPEEIENGAPEEMDVPISFDQSNFFA
jgi:hypothetical protein